MFLQLNLQQNILNLKNIFFIILYIHILLALMELMILEEVKDN